MSSKGKKDTKKKTKCSLKYKLDLRCIPCTLTFNTSTALAFHVFNVHNTQPEVSVTNVEPSAHAELLQNYIATASKPPVKEKKPRKKRTLQSTEGGPKPKRQRKEKILKVSAKDLKVALVATDENSIPKIKIGRFNTLDTYNIESPNTDKRTEISAPEHIKPPGEKPKESEKPAPTTSANSLAAEDGFSNLMSEVCKVLDDQDSTYLNGATTSQSSTLDVMKDIQGLYDDEMAYSQLASSLEVPQIKMTTSYNMMSPSLNPYSSSSTMNMFSTSSSLVSQPSLSDYKMDSMTSFSQHLDSLLTKNSSTSLSYNSGSTLYNSSTSSYTVGGSYNSAFSSVSSAFTSVTNNSSAFTVPNVTKPLPSSYMSPDSTNMSSLHSPGNSGSSRSTPTNQPSLQGINIKTEAAKQSPSPSAIGSPCDAKKEGGRLNIVPTEKLIDTSAKPSLVNSPSAVPSNSSQSYYGMMGSNTSGTPSYNNYYNSYNGYPGYMGGYPSEQTMSSSQNPYYNSYPSTTLHHTGLQATPPPPPLTSAYPSLSPNSTQVSTSPSQHPQSPYGEQFKKPSEPPNKQPKIVLKKLSSLMQPASEKTQSLTSSGPSTSSLPPQSSPYYPAQRSSAPTSLPNNRFPAPGGLNNKMSGTNRLNSARPPLNRLVSPIKMGVRPTLKPSSLPPRPSKSPEIAIIGETQKKPPPSSNPPEDPAASMLKKRGITISSIVKPPPPPTRKLNSAVNIIPVVSNKQNNLKRPPDKVGQVEIVPKINFNSSTTSSKNLDLIQEPESNLGIPVINLSNKALLNNLSQMGICNFLPVSQIKGSNQMLGLPIISTSQSNTKLNDLGACGMLSLGSVYKLK